MIKLRKGATAQVVAWSALLAGAALARLWDLGQRAMSHDESLHAYYSHILAQSGAHHHDPMMHGPLLFQLGAALMGVFGPDDFVARLGLALAGVGLAASPLLLRRWLGDWGAFWAGALIAFSPSLLFYSRYMRNDVLFGLLCMFWLWAALGFLRTGRAKWLWPNAVAMALCFACKETVFIFGVFFGGYLLITGLWRAHRAGRSPRQEPAAQLAWLTLCMALPFAAPLVHLALGWSVLDYASQTALWRAIIVTGALGFVAAGLAWLWLGDHAWWGGEPPELDFYDFLGPASLMWIIDLLLFGNWGRNLGGGLASGLVGSGGYWLAQHEVARGGQPWFYYPMLLAIYEFAPLLLAVCAAVALARRARSPLRRQRQRPAQPLDMPIFCLAWALFGLAAYSLAGEKMPWLLAHMALPLCLLGGWWLGRFVQRLAPLQADAPLIVAGWALPLLLGVLVMIPPFAGRGLAELAHATHWLGALAAALLLVGLALWRRPKIGWRRWAGLLALGALALVVSLNARAAWLACFVNHEQAVELLVYAHASPQLKPALARAVAASQATGRPMAHDQQTSWPMAWYLGQHAGGFIFNDPDDPRLSQASALFVGEDMAPDVLQRLAGRAQASSVIRLWWPPQDYQGLGWRALADRLARPGFWRDMAAYWWARDLPGGRPEPWPLRSEMLIILPAPAAGAAATAPAPPPSTDATIADQ